jgi:hypothetical protein
MSVINVNVTNAGAASVSVSSGTTVSATVGNGGSVNVSTGTISPGNATVVSGTLTINSVTTLAAGSSAYVKNDTGTAFAAKLDIGIPAGPATSVTVAKTTTLAAGSSATVTGATDGGNFALSFGIPAGAAGTNGTNGTTPTITATATTLSAGSSATVTATPSDGGSKVALAFGIPAGAAGAGGGASLSDATPSALGTAAAGTSSTASRSDHVHATQVISYANLTNVPSTFAPSTHTHTASQITDLSTSVATSVAGRTGEVVIGTDDVVGLATVIAAVDVESIDGGDYVGVVVTPTPSITITAQPSSQSVSTSTANEVSSTLPSGNWGYISRANSQWFTSGWQATQADYLAVSTDGSSWTKRYGLPVAGNWSAIQYANSVYATQAGNVLAYSSDATTWSSATHAATQGTVFAAGGKFVRSTTTGIFTSTDAQNWTQTASYSATSSTMLFNYAGTTWFAGDGTSLRVSTDNAATWSSPLGFNAGYGFNNIVPFGADFYFGRISYVARYSGGAFGGSYPSSSFPQLSNGSQYGGTFATNGSLLVLYMYAKRIFTSTNGTTWVERTLPAAIPANETGNLLYSGGTFALVFGTTYFTSTNGTDWTQRTRANTTYGGQNTYLSGGYLASHNGSSWNYIQIGASDAVASLSVSAYLASGTLTYQWQLSTDGGTTFANISGATSNVLSLSGLTAAADNGKRYRCILSATGVASVTSSSATLTVT